MPVAGWRATSRSTSLEKRVAVVSDVVLHLLVNGESRAVPVDWTVRRLLDDLGLRERRVAVAINRDVVPRSEYGTHPLSPGDRIEILEAVGGG